jgi:hypothetical protein
MTQGFRYDDSGNPITPSRYDDTGNPIYDEQKSLGGFASNLWKSGKGVAGDLASVVTSPWETAKNLGKLTAGTVQLAIPGEQGYEAYPKAVAEQYKERYGGLDNITDTLYNDPLGALSDVGTLVGGGAGLLRATATTAGVVNKVAKSGRVASAVERATKAADTATRVANYTDPLSLAVPLAGKEAGAGLEWSGLKGMGRAIGGPRGSMNKMAEAWQMTESQLRDYLARHSDKRGTAPSGAGVLKLRDLVNDANAQRIGLERAASAGGATVDAQKVATQTARDIFSTPQRANNPELAQPLPDIRVGSNPYAKSDAAKGQMRVFTTYHPSLTTERGWGLKTTPTETLAQSLDMTASPVMGKKVRNTNLLEPSASSVSFETVRNPDTLVESTRTVPGDGLFNRVQFDRTMEPSLEGVNIAPYFDTRRTPDKRLDPMVAGQNIRAINAENVDSYGPNSFNPEASRVSKAEAKNLSTAMQDTTKPFVPEGKDDWATLGANMHDDLNLLEALRQRAYNSQQSPIRLYEFLGLLKGDPAIMALGTATRPAPLWRSSRGAYRTGKAMQNVDTNIVADALRAALLARMPGQGQ